MSTPLLDITSWVPEPTPPRDVLTRGAVLTAVGALVVMVLGGLWSWICA